MADKPEETRQRQHGANDGDLESLKADLATLRTELAAVVKAIQGLGATAVATAKRQHGGAIAHLAGEAEELTANVAAAGRAQIGALEQRIREQPLAAVGIAFAAGLVFGSLRRR